MTTEPTVNVVDEITLAVALAITILMMISRWRRGEKVLNDRHIASDLLNGITLIPFAMFTSTVVYPKILDEIAKYALFVSVAGLLAIIHVIAELYKGAEPSGKKT